MAEVTLSYVPRLAFLPFHNRSERFSSLVCHRRAGKTVACVNDLVAKALHTKKKNARYAYVAPFYRQAKDVAWTYLKEATKDIASKVREADLRIELPNGAWITLYGADNPDALRGLYFDGIVLDEFGDCRPALWAEVILPALLDRRGWAVFIGTPKGKNHFYHMNERAKKEDSWFQLTLKASQSGIISEADLAEVRASGMSEEQYEQELECSFEAAVQGTYYSKIISQMENDGRIGMWKYDPTKPVWVSSDLGFTDSTAFWFAQIDEQGPYLFDYEEHSGRALPYYVDLLNDKGYNYEKFWVPHDAKAANFQTGRSTIEQFLAYGFPTEIVPKLKKQHGIDAARWMLERCRIDQVGCYDGIEALRAYKRKFNDKTQQFSNDPEHDWSSNGSDSFRYFSLMMRERLQPEQKEAIVAQPILKAPAYTLDQLFKENERGDWRNKIIRI